MCGAANFHSRYGNGVYGVQRKFPLVSVGEDTLCVNVGETSRAETGQDIVSQCRSAKSALMRVRVLCVPDGGGGAVVVPPGMLVAVVPFPKTVVPGTSVAMPWKVTVAPDA